MIRTLSFLALAASVLTASPVQPEALAPTRAAYAALKSYADTGTITAEYGTPGAVIAETHTFRTAFRAPRHFVFQFEKDKTVSLERVAVWGDATGLHSWWSAIGAEETYPPGSGALAFATMAAPTYNVVLQIAALVFPQAGLTGTLSDVVEARDTGTETISGHPCRKLVGKAQSTYGTTGNVTNARQVTIWIDVDTKLLRKIVEDASTGGVVSRSTMIFDPRVNPPLDDSAFRFTPPK